MEGLQVDGIEKVGGIRGEDSLLPLDTATVDPEDTEQLGDGMQRGVRGSSCEGESI